MLLTLEEVEVRTELDRSEIHRFIQQSWILPEQEDGLYFFDEADVARLRLIVELRGDLEVNDEAVPIILQLLDQVHALRHAVDELQGAIEALPESARAELEAAMKKAARKK